MIAEAESILQSFDMLPDEQKRAVASEILRRSLKLDESPLSDEVLASEADELFLELDRREAEHG